MGYDVVTVGVVCADVMVRPVDTIPPRGTLGLVPILAMHLGGLAGVTAVVCSRLGGKSAFVGRLGRDSFGDFLLAKLNENGVNTAGGHRVDTCNSSATVVLISEDGERTFLHHMGTNAEACEEDIDFDVVRESKVLHWGGPAITPKLDGEPMGRVFEKARALGVKTSMDTCYDGKGVWLPLIEPSLPHLDIVFSSYEEARNYTGREEVEAIADFYLSYGVEIAVIKLGADGLFLKGHGQSLRLPAHRVPCVVDPTGAGDPACGGFLYGYTSGWDLEHCGRLANAVGGLTVQRMGGSEAVESLEKTMAFRETLHG
jgi:sugar/nucleoside kinase (ribokinase family)